MSKALIYCRVSDPKQMKEGHGLEGQEHACRAFAERQGFDVQRVFHDEGITGASQDRPAFMEMMEYIEKQQTSFKIIIDDIARLARDHIVYAHLKRQLTRLGCELVFLNMKFEETPEGNYVETILAATAELERKQNARRTQSRMIERMKAGFYVSNPPYGYTYEKHPSLGKVLVKDEPFATYIKEALEGFASGRFATKTKVKYFLEARTGKPIHVTSVLRLLKRKFYVGVLESPKHGICVKGQHEPLITQETFDKIQDRLLTEGRQVYHTDKKHLYPLKGFVTCHICKKALTAGKSRGKGGYYAYYSCHNIKCTERGKTTPQQMMEGQFVELIENARICPDVLDMTYDVCQEVNAEYKERAHQAARKRKQDITALNQEINTLTDRFIATQSTTLQEKIEQRIHALEAKKIGLESGSVRKGHKPDFRTVWQTVKEVLQNPKKLWITGDFEQKQIIQNIVFEGPLAYERRKGFRTPEKSLPFRVLGDIDSGGSLMVGHKLVSLNTTNLMRALYHVWEQTHRIPKK